MLCVSKAAVAHANDVDDRRGSGSGHHLAHTLQDKPADLPDDAACRVRLQDVKCLLHKNADITLAIQFAIRCSILDLTTHMSWRMQTERVAYKSLAAGFGLTAAIYEESPDFYWKDYCPMAFRGLREIFGMSSAGFIASLCENNSLKRMSSPGKSGSIFYSSRDEKLIIKTLRRAEVKVLLRILPEYLRHVSTYRNTLLTRFFGLYSLKFAGRPKVRLLVMNNVLPPDPWVHRKFDLKGSSQGRQLDRGNIRHNMTLKDLDLNYVFHLDSSARDGFLEQISLDCKFLESQRIMDYSVLLGLHFWAPHPPPADLERGAWPEVDLMVKPSVECATNGWHGLLTTASFDGDDAQSCVNMPSKAYWHVGDVGPTAQHISAVALCCGIIDILQDYSVIKRLENGFKSIKYDSYSISAVRPADYSKRFQEFMRKIFLSAKSGG